MNFNDYSKIVFIGGGGAAERLYKQIDGIEGKLIGVADFLTDEERKIKSFHEINIKNISYLEDILKQDDVAILYTIAAGEFFIELLKDTLKFLDKCNIDLERVFVINPFTQLRPFYFDNELISEERIPYDDDIYKESENLFEDKLSKKIFKLLTTSKYYDGLEDTYEIVSYNSIKDVYYMGEDYWISYLFENKELCKENYATVFDCGAYIGDSIIPITDAIPEKRVNYYAFEPFPDSADKIRENAELFKKCEKLEILPFGVSDEEKELTFNIPLKNNLLVCSFREVESPDDTMFLPIRKIDNLDIEIKGQLYIKMDIEGMELKALKGAEKTILKNRPCLAICLYHRKNDLALIPTYLKSLLPDYKFYLRGGIHTILWAMPPEK